ncbi:MAG: DegT/DnrJ/EryC1/StrS family aminotransferase [Myxococcales bacterium]
MLLSRAHATPPFPFEAPGARFYYFGRNAVWTAARVLGLDKGEVLLPAYHHGVEVEALADAGASLRFYRVGPRMQVDPDDVKAQLTPRTRAIYLIHYLGFPGPAQALRELADEHGLPLVEDCALALLSRAGDRPLGTYGDAAIFSLYKSLPVPHGGALVLASGQPQGLPWPSPPPSLSTLSHLLSSLLCNAELRGGALGRALRQAARGLGHAAVGAAHVERVATGTQHFERANAHLGMSPLAKRLALCQDFAAIAERRRRNFFFLLGHLRDVAPPVFTELPAGAVPLFYPLRVPDKTGVMARLAARGVETVDFWRRGHPACVGSEFPDVEVLRREILEIPVHQDLEPENMTALAAAVREAVREGGRP